MTGRHLLFGWRGSGSAIVEAQLALCGVDYEVEDVAGFDRPGPQRERLASLNPRVQVPTLVLPTGEIMTESAAITLLLAERHPRGGLAPGPDDPLRPQFLRRLVWLAAALYPTVTLADYPERWVEHERERLAQAAERDRLRLWGELEAATAGMGPWVLGSFSALDLFVGVMSRWRPGPEKLRSTCPRLVSVWDRLAEEPIVGPILRRHFGA